MSDEDITRGRRNAARNDFDSRRLSFPQGCNFKSRHNILKSKLRRKPECQAKRGGAIFPGRETQLALTVRECLPLGPFNGFRRFLPSVTPLVEPGQLLAATPI